MAAVCYVVFSCVRGWLFGRLVVRLLIVSFVVCYVLLVAGCRLLAVCC